MRPLIVLALLAGPAHAAQDPHAHHQPPAKPAPDPHAEHKTPADPHAGHGGPAKPAPDPHAHHQKPAPRPPSDHAADAIFGTEEMAAARARLKHEHGAHIFSKVMFDALEAALGREDGYRWDAEAWMGGDLHRAVVKTHGEGESGLHKAEVQAFYSRAIGPYFDLQAGLRHDFKPEPSLTYAAFGVEGLAPYWFEVEAMAYLSEKGDLLARVGASYDQLLTQRLALQPQAELNFAARNMPAQGVGKGLSEIALGLRLRYELRREFAPYIGVSYERKLGATADYARAGGEGAGAARFVVGIRAWF